jgi:hypothetical protein
MTKKLPEQVKKNPKRFILVPQMKSVISTHEFFVGKKYNHQESLNGLKEIGLEGSSIVEFMTHRANLMKAAAGKTKLLYADGRSVSKNAASSLWNYMSLRNRSYFDDRPCCTWLNARFVKGKGFLGLDLVIQRLRDGNLVEEREPLEKCSQETWYVTLDSLNGQGLAKKKSGMTQYNRDKNIFQIVPCEGEAAWFEVDSNGAALECVGNPTGADVWRGIYASTQLTQ